MQRFEGTDREVIVVDGVVLKVARAEPVRSMRSTLRVRHRGSDYVRSLWRFPEDVQGVPRNMLLHGVRANQREARIAAAYPDIVVTTRMLFSGLVNIQPFLPRPGILDRDVAPAFSAQLGVKIPVIGHVLESADNFGVDDTGNVVFVDGGGDGLERMIGDQTYRRGIQSALAELTDLHHNNSGTISAPGES